MIINTNIKNTTIMEEYDENANLLRNEYIIISITIRGINMYDDTFQYDIKNISDIIESIENIAYTREKLMIRHKPLKFMYDIFSRRITINNIYCNTILEANEILEMIKNKLK